MQDTVTAAMQNLALEETVLSAQNPPSTKTVTQANIPVSTQTLTSAKMLDTDVKPDAALLIPKTDTMSVENASDSAFTAPVHDIEAPAVAPHADNTASTQIIASPIQNFRGQATALESQGKLAVSAQVFTSVQTSQNVTAHPTVPDSEADLCTQTQAIPSSQKAQIATPMSDSHPLVPAGPSALVKRRLVTVRRIKNITDAKMGNKVLIHVDGWTVLDYNPPFMETQKWKVGELVLFFEIDSFLPKTQNFLDLFTNPKRITTFNGKPGYRVMSVVKGKFFSQGQIFRLNNFWEIYGPFQARIKQAGLRLATEELMARSFEDLLGVVKWEPSAQAISAGVIGTTPGFIVNPSWYRAQNLEREIFAKSWQHKVWQVTEKLDGVSMHVYKVSVGSRWLGCLPALPQGYPATMRDGSGRGHIGVCSRTQDFLDQPGNVYWEAAKGRSAVASKIWEIPYPNISVQGELCGSSIMGNTMKLPEGEHRFVVFGIWNFDTAAYVDVKEVAKICSDLQIDHVPILGYYKISDFAGNMKALLEKANGVGTGAFGGISEGFVFRSLDGKHHFKVISNEWLAVTGK